MRTYILPTVLKKVNGIGRPRRQQLWILPPLKMLRLHGSSYVCLVHLQPLPTQDLYLQTKAQGIP